MPPGLIGLFRELHENGNDSRIFAGGRIDEEPVVNEGLDCTLGSIVWIRRPNNGYRPELGVKKDCRLRHDQVGLEQVGRGNGCASSHGVCAGVGIQSVIEVGEAEVAVGDVRRVRGLVVPDLEMHGLAWPDTEQDSEYFKIGDFLGETWIQAAATLFDEAKVESRGVRDGLEMVGYGAVWI